LEEVEESVIAKSTGEQEEEDIAPQMRHYFVTWIQERKYLKKRRIIENKKGYRKTSILCKMQVQFTR
jgi:hypothetical protein